MALRMTPLKSTISTCTGSWWRIDDDHKTYELSTLYQKHVGNDSEDLQSMKHQDCLQK